MSTGLYVFWKYDHYPFLLGGPLERMEAGGRARVTGYEGFTFHPVLTLNAEDGARLRAELEELERGYRAAEKDLSKQWRGRVQHAVVQTAGRALPHLEKP